MRQLRLMRGKLTDWAAVRFGTEFDDAAEVLAVEDCDEDDEGQ